LYPAATGEFVGSVRAGYNAVLEKFISECCETEIFKCGQTKEVINYVRDKYCNELEFLWQKFPDCAVFRRQDTNTWYGIILTVSRAKLGLNSKEAAEVLDLRIQPEDIDSVVDGKKYFYGYHMNKKSWYTIVLDGSVPTEEIFMRIDNSYNLAAQKKGKSKTKQL
ncbi:MAG: MmcQ/YjbR family DNA-binding protein, partial [Clostridia bacterium]|nr:MmcQ/YjbR family DNA-binding protein [Clostridia bacterium]